MEGNDTLKVLKKRDGSDLFDERIMNIYGVLQVPSAQPIRAKEMPFGGLRIDEADRFMLRVASGWAP